MGEIKEKMTLDTKQVESALGSLTSKFEKSR